MRQPLHEAPKPDRANIHLVALITFAVVSVLPQIANARPFQIQVVDKATSRGIPLVILETSLSTRHVTDSNGNVAFDEPIAMGHDIFFKPISDGYSYQAPPLAMGGAVLKAEPGTSATLVMRRDMIAERLYRITGAGIYKDTLALGGQAPIVEPLLNAGVIGQDSTLSALYKGKIFWVWGDTSRMGHPLSANYRVTAAMSDLPTSGGLAINQGVNLDYIKKTDFVKPMITIGSDDRSGVYWLTGLMNVPDAVGSERLLSWYNQITMPGMKTVKRGIVEFHSHSEEFRPVAEHLTTATLQPTGHSVRVSTPAGNFQYITSSDGQFRVRDGFEAAANPAEYEALTCLLNDGPFTTETAQVARDENGTVLYRWRKGVAPTGAAQQRQLVEAGLLKAKECIFRPVDVSTEEIIIPHALSIAWNAHRSRWIMIASEMMGTSMLGEVWYLEADHPEGPWIKAVKVLTHDTYSFYNPLQHPELTAPDDPHLYFEGTYTKTFSAAPVATPWYDYNQIMYRIDLNDARLQMPPANKNTMDSFKIISNDVGVPKYEPTSSE